MLRDVVTLHFTRAALYEHRKIAAYDVLHCRGRVSFDDFRVASRMTEFFSRTRDYYVSRTNRAPTPVIHIMLSLRAPMSVHVLVVYRSRVALKRVHCYCCTDFFFHPTLVANAAPPSWWFAFTYDNNIRAIYNVLRYPLSRLVKQIFINYSYLLLLL